MTLSETHFFMKEGMPNKKDFLFISKSLVLPGPRTSPLLCERFVSSVPSLTVTRALK